MLNEKLKKRLGSAFVTAVCTCMLISSVVMANPEGQPDPEDYVAVVTEDDKQDREDTDTTEEKEDSSDKTDKIEDIQESQENKTEKKSENKAEKTEKNSSKKSDTTVAKNTDTGKKTSGTGSAGSGSSGSTGSSGSSGSSGGSSGGSQNQPSKPSHTHSFSIPITQTINHPAEYTQVYHPEEGHEVQRCKTCNAINPDSAHAEAHALAGEDSGTYSDWVIDKAAWTENVMIKAPWTEERVVGYKCSCGAVQ